MKDAQFDPAVHPGEPKRTADDILKQLLQPASQQSATPLSASTSQASTPPAIADSDTDALAGAKRRRESTFSSTSLASDAMPSAAEDALSALTHQLRMIREHASSASSTTPVGPAPTLVALLQNSTPGPQYSPASVGATDGVSGLAAFRMTPTDLLHSAQQQQFAQMQPTAAGARATNGRLSAKRAKMTPSAKARPAPRRDSGIPAQLAMTLPETSEPPEETEAVRRGRKNNREKQRRSEVNTMFDELNEVLGLPSNVRLDKISLLFRAIETINSLRSQVRVLSGGAVEPATARPLDAAQLEQAQQQHAQQQQRRQQQ